MKPQEVAENLYDRLFSGKGGERLCTDIPEAACPRVGWNFFVQLGARLATKLGDALASPRLVLSWLMAGIGVSPGLIGLIVPLREAGSLLPQLVIGSAVQRHAIRKWFWVWGSFVQGAAVLGMAAAAFSMRGSAAGWAIVALVTLFSLARGVCSVTSKDLTGRTIPRGRRGRLDGISASGAGIVTVLFGAALIAAGPETLATGVFSTILVVAGALWLLAAAIMSRLAEVPAVPESGGNAMRLALSSLRILRDDRQFLRFVVARGLLASTVLSMPFYVLLARNATGGGASTFGLFLIASNLAMAASGFLWGRMADRSSRRTLSIAGGLAAAIGFVAYAFSGLPVVEARWLGIDAAGWLYAAMFFALSLAHTGIRVARKTYLIDFAPSEQRASYVAVSNTVIGVVLLLAGGVGILGDVLSPREVVLTFAALGLGGALLSLSLDEVE